MGACYCDGLHIREVEQASLSKQATAFLTSNIRMCFQSTNPVLRRLGLVEYGNLLIFLNRLASVVWMNDQQRMKREYKLISDLEESIDTLNTVLLCPIILDRSSGHNNRKKIAMNFKPILDDITKIRYCSKINGKTRRKLLREAAKRLTAILKVIVIPYL